MPDQAGPLLVRLVCTRAQEWRDVRLTTSAERRSGRIWRSWWTWMATSGLSIVVRVTAGTIVVDVEGPNYAPKVKRETQKAAACQAAAGCA